MHIAELTLSVIMLIGIAHPNIPVWLNSLSRLAETVIGAAIAILFAWLFSLLPGLRGNQTPY